MDSAKNKRLLLAACQANGIALPDGAPPSYMQARILGLRPAKMARTDEEAPPLLDHGHSRTEQTPTSMDRAKDMFCRILAVT